MEHLVVANDIATKNVVTVTPDDDLTVAMEKFGRKGIPFLPVVADGDSNKLVGRLHRRDAIEAYNKAVMMRSQDERE